MTSNKEFLDNLAATDPQALQAWFDAPYTQVDESAACVTKTPDLLDVESVDSREKLESDVREYYRIGLPGIQETELHRLYYEQVIEWLDRQEVITTRQLSDSQIIKECRDWERWCKNAEKANRALWQQVDNLRAENEALMAAHLDDVERLDAMGEGELMRKLDELQAQVDALNSENSEFADGQDYWHDKCDELQRKLDNLAHDIAESERFREEMREELSIAYDHAHDLLARRDRGLA